MTVRNLIPRAFQPILLCLIFLEATLSLAGSDLSLPAAPAAQKADESYLPDQVHPPLTKTQEAFKDWKFGIFIHWGPYSTINKEWSMKRYKDMPPGEFERRAREFNPQDFDARNWVDTAKAAGARYITFISKHHDGFCNFASKLTDYTSMHTPAKKDFVALLAAECHRQKIPLFIYYSPVYGELIY
jgi:alpha-L-fucosidase